MTRNTDAVTQEPGPERTLRVLIVDDDALVRAGLTMMLDGAGTDATTIRVVGEAGDGDEVPDALAAHPSDVVLMDLRMPRVDGIAATERLRATPGAPEVVVLTTFHTDAEIVGALRAGASGYLLKDTPPQEIVAALARVADGDAVLSPEVTRHLISRTVGEVGPREAARRRLDRLSEREAEVAREIGRGATNAEIAVALFLSVATVKAYVSTVLTKLEVGNRTQIALLVHDGGWLSG
ncbi:response regulator transcription factor [Occultella glacieicola]|uniref:response regulator transcription factor n=1 Tax=Occultella glacieicola TaxID=2518684 RepID=UPI0022A8A04E|nr:response regulator transcription factor [Occultella glacieicola]